MILTLVAWNHCIMCFLSHAETFNRKQFVFAQFVLVFKLISRGFFVRYESLFTEHLGRLILCSVSSVRWADGGVMWPPPAWCWCSLEIAVVRRPETTLHQLSGLQHTGDITVPYNKSKYVPRNTSASMITAHNGHITPRTIIEPPTSHSRLPTGSCN